MSHEFDDGLSVLVPVGGIRRTSCEHTFVTSDGSAYARLRRAIQSRNLAIIRVSAAELPHVSLRDALGILLVIEVQAEERFESAAVRWAGRLALEAPALTLAELAGALESLEALPDEHAQRSLMALAERARRRDNRG
jgi:enoyl-CoA hydratase/carnithine racemase